MKKLLIIFAFFFTFTVAAKAQQQQQQCSTLDDCNQKLGEAAQMINKLIEVKKTDDKTFADLQANVAALRAQIVELERARMTPCSIAQEKLKLDLTGWLDQYGSAQLADRQKRKEIEKILKQTRRLGSKAVAAQCGFTDKSWLAGFLETSSRFAPLLLFLK